MARTWRRNSGSNLRHSETGVNLRSKWRERLGWKNYSCVTSLGTAGAFHRLAEIAVAAVGNNFIGRVRSEFASMREVDYDVWQVSSLEYDPGYFDDETCRLEPIENPPAAKVLPISPE